jgi:hypothetical protein
MTWSWYGPLELWVQQMQKNGSQDIKRIKNIQGTPMSCSLQKTYFLLEQ